MKLKTHSATKKRVRVTGTGKIRVMKSSKRHLLINKSRKAKRSGTTSGGVILNETLTERAHKLLPYV